MYHVPSSKVRVACKTRPSGKQDQDAGRGLDTRQAHTQADWLDDPMSEWVGCVDRGGRKYWM